MKVPQHMELKKQELISRQEQSFQMMKKAKHQFEAKQKAGEKDGSDQGDE